MYKTIYYNIGKIIESTGVYRYKNNLKRHIFSYAANKYTTYIKYYIKNNKFSLAAV